MAFATPEDVATRLGRELTTIEAGTVEFLLTTVEALILDAVSRDAAWAVALDPVPDVLRGLTAEKVASVMANPSGLASESEQLGAYSYTRTMPRSQDGVGITLTDAEGRLARMAVWGTNSGSAMLGSIFEETE